VTPRPAATGACEAVPALIAIGALSAVILAGSAVIVCANPASTAVDRVVPAVVATVFCATGIVAWWRRPHNRSGLLLVATGISFALLGLGASDLPGLHDAGIVLRTLPLAMILHVVLAFPSGRLGDTGTRILVGLGYLSPKVDGDTGKVYSTGIAALPWRGARRCSVQPWEICSGLEHPNSRRC
jgi:hypothetical protein